MSTTYSPSRKCFLQDANEKVGTLPRHLTSFKILNALLNCLNQQTYQPFLQTQDIIAKEILACDDLQALAEEYDDYFLVPMRVKGAWPRSRPGSARQGVQDTCFDSDSSSYKSSGFQSKVHERYGLEGD
jgi:hypothetical protein